MTTGNNALAIVMARAGSKRIPRKNIRLFCGKPMVTWPVRHACASGLFSEVIISTDDQSIALCAEEAGAVFHGLRPDSLSNDYATTAEVLRYELLRAGERLNDLPAVCCCLYGTSALLDPQLLCRGYQALLASEADLLLAVIPYGHPIERALQFDAAGLIQYKHLQFALTRTQDIVPSYHDSGLFYWFRTDALLQSDSGGFASMKKTAVSVPARTAVDIDTEEDWELAEMIASHAGLNNAYA